MPRTFTKSKTTTSRASGARSSRLSGYERGRAANVDFEQVRELLYQALETEMGGIQVYQTAIGLAQNDDVRKEWQKYLEQTEGHERILLGVFEALGLDPDMETPGRKVVRQIGECLVNAMQMAARAGHPEQAQVVAAECIVLAETKDHANWELIGEVAKGLDGERKRILKEAHDEVEEEEDEHLYHTMGWTRELWLECLGLPAVLPPPEEEKEVKSAIGAARAKNARKQMLPKRKTAKPARKAAKPSGRSARRPAKASGRGTAGRAGRTSVRVGGQGRPSRR